ncbi:alpha-D-ribose 1-methylphosphonate 5-triphosphate diphosphatase [Variibacter gotjawalensis]|uniref:Alpha-D-ribose 1-methylphosphonate 5-triphosphate diphosphatase n=2 Tax=Variibacter gotjawalensis TaxID=1333996 RepID=A0A0S3PT47_9BRAD|nr:alpha-D-ribose 1-methylphosphonate 5-triphosphate diphosphatase [Variibacter gotjawalensis]BAT59119.1 alpha-D-ribose 1-methylphosphonate 5-triphosphate diphosphatase [Variibacter gotjawalensis]
MLQLREMTLSNARVVLADRVIDNGWLTIADGIIADFGEGTAPRAGEDCAGDLVMPGLIELHTDHLEAHYQPRPKVMWDPLSAVISYDAQLATAGVTTVLDSLRVWSEELEGVDGDAKKLQAAIERAQDAKLLRSNHYLHLRCEIPTASVVDQCAELIGKTEVRLVSLMDHTPGQRQFRDAEKLRAYYRGKRGGVTDDELDHVFSVRRDLHEKYAAANRRALVGLAHQHSVPLASHDDTTLEHVDESVQDKVAVAEFPTTMEAAEASHRAGIKVMMGAPNIVRGGSHSGNVAAAELAQAGFLDVLSSDYVPSSLLDAALRLPQVAPSIDLAAAIRTVTSAPAEAVGFADRGEIARGKRADIIRVNVGSGVPVVRSVLNGGRRVA